MKNNVAFTLIPFTVMKWDDCLSVQLPFELPVQVPIQLLLELEANWPDQSVNELEFELPILNVDVMTIWPAQSCDFMKQNYTFTLVFCLLI